MNVTNLKTVETIVLTESVSSPFDFESTARSHGWVALRPFEWHTPTATLVRIHRLDSGKVARLQMRAGDQNGHQSVIQIGVDTVARLTPDEETEIGRAVRRMLRLDEDLTEFYQLRNQIDGWNLRLQPGGGRLLRCPRLFEDIIYTMCTTNITWSGTKRLVERLTMILGDSFPGQETWRAFPTATAIAAVGSGFLKDEIRLGYRAVYVWELAAAVAENRLDLQTLEDPERPTDELLKNLLQIKGIGPYAAATLLMLLSRYEYLAVDTELRAHVSKKYFQSQSVTEAQMRAIYAPWGKWQYLAYWFDSPA